MSEEQRYGRCACCEKDAVVYCHAKDAWVCADDFTPSAHTNVSEVAYYQKVQEVIVLCARLKDADAELTRLRNELRIENENREILLRSIDPLRARVRELEAVVDPCRDCASLRVEVERLRGRNLSLESDRNLRWRLRDELEEELGVKGLEIDDQLQKALEVIKDLRRAGKV